MEAVVMKQSAIDHLYVLHRTPYAMASVIHSFYAQTESQERDILLSYLILPFVLYKPLRDFLKNSKSSSTVESMCSDNSRMLGLAPRIEEMRRLTNDSLMLLISGDNISVAEDSRIISLTKPNSLSCDRQAFNAAGKLAKIFSGRDVVSIYRTIGLKRL